MKDQIEDAPSPDEIIRRYIKAIGKGLLKVMSKMGISTYQSFCGAQIFDAVGLKADFVARFFTGTHGRLESTDMVRRKRTIYRNGTIVRIATEVGHHRRNHAVRCQRAPAKTIDSPCYLLW